MKKILLLFLLVFAGCSGVEVIRDEYRNTTVVQLPLNNTSDGFFDAKRSQEIVFKRLIDSSKKETLSARLIVHLSKSDEPLTENLFLKINDRVFELRVENISTSNETKSGVYRNQNTGENQHYTYSVQEGKGTVNLTTEIREAFMRCSSFQVRVYSGDRPISFTYSGLDVAKLQHFLSYEVD